MKVISFLNKKGGAGKSTALSAIGLFMAHRLNKRVAVQDMEVKGLAGRFVQHIDHPNLTPYEKGGEYDYVLIDAEGNLTDAEFFQIEANSDLVIIPLDISPADIAETYDTVQLLKSPKKARLLFTRVETNTDAWRNRDAATKIIKLKRMKAFIKKRNAYKTMLVRGWDALSKNGDAIKELKQLAGEIS